MVTYPIHIRRDGYRGSAPRRKRKAQEINQIAADLERIINKIILQQTRPMKRYLYQEIAEVSGYPVSIISEICFSLDCGSNGFTVIREDLANEQAVAETPGKSDVADTSKGE